MDLTFGRLEANLGLFAGAEAIRSGRNQYGMTWGQPSLRKAIAQKSRRFYEQEDASVLPRSVANFAAFENGPSWMIKVATVDGRTALVDQDNRRQLADAIAQLVERDRIVVTLYYFENLTLAEIGRVLGVTESRACQLHTRAVLRLRTKLAEHADV